MPSRPTALTLGAFAAAALLTACGSTSTSAQSGHPTTSTAATSTATTATGSSPAPMTSAATTSAATTGAATSTPAPRTTPGTTVRAAPAETRTAKPTSTRLPLDLDTGRATQVITVVSSGSRDTTATVQRWSKSGSGWRRVGSRIDAYVGSDGIGRASESTSETPAGSFTLTQAFGRDADPGTRLPYVRTTPDDYWISSPGSKYNTRQRCGDCGYNNGVNERLYYVTPEYDHAVVIDYNTANAPGGVKQGRGSAFFLHIEHGEPTAGCVAIPRDDLTDVMRWLRPADSPRILIGTS